MTIASRLLAAALCMSALACGQPRPSEGDPPPAASTNPPEQPGGEAPASEGPLATEPELPVAANLHYLEIVLGGAKPDDPLPMIVAIHGLGDDPENFGHLLETFQEPARLILPRGLDPRDAGGWSWFPLRARDADVAALASGIDRAGDEIAKGVAVLVTQRPTLGKPVVTGFSQGGMLSFAIAIDHPELVSAALPVGGWLPPPLLPADRAPADAPAILAFHGTDDTAVRHEPTVQSVAQLVERGWHVTLKSYDGVGHVITPEIHRDLTDGLVDAIRRASRSKPEKKAG
ncbi:MAG TPA: dienelactone hydrolase family protein [Nannocystaceae bacterium]|nr:dienelactone hydrolase family protein [Nannocystaceae bacterium]